MTARQSVIRTPLLTTTITAVRAARAKTKTTKNQIKPKPKPKSKQYTIRTDLSKILWPIARIAGRGYLIKESIHAERKQ